MKSKFYRTASFVLMLVFLFLVGTAAAQPGSPCDPVHVVRAGKIIDVNPTGVDDTANIQCAFDWANDLGPGMTIRLAPDTFHTAQILVTDFLGSFRGNGVHRTVITNLPDLYVIPDIETIPPSPDHPWPGLFTFLDSDVNLSNLAIRIVGQNPVTTWYIGSYGPFNQFGSAIMISGTESVFRASSISVEGEPSATSPLGYNVFNGIFFQGYFTTTGVNFEPLSGTFAIRNSSFKSIAWATPVLNLNDARVVIDHNTYSDVHWAFDAGDLLNTSYTASSNRIEANEGGIQFYNAGLSANTGTDYLVWNNIIAGPVGIVMYQTIDEGGACLIKNNNLRWVTDTPIFLGEGATACVLHNNRE